MSKRTHRIWRLLLTRAVLFPLMILAIGAYVVTTSFSYNEPETGLFAGVAGSILIALTVLVLVREIRRELAGLHPRPDRVSPQAKIRNGRRYPLLIAFAWCAGLFVALFLIGFQPAIPIWVFFYLLWNRASPILTISLPVVLWAMVTFVIGRALGTLFFEGILFGGIPPSLW